MPESPQIQDDSAELETRMAEVAEELREVAARLTQAISDEGAKVEDRVEGGVERKLEALEAAAASAEIPDEPARRAAEDRGDESVSDVETEPEVEAEVEAEVGAEAEVAARAPVAMEFAVGPEEVADMRSEMTEGDEEIAEGDDEAPKRRVTDRDDPDSRQIRSLDDELAQLAEDLIAGEVSDDLESPLESSEEDDGIEEGEGADKGGDAAPARAEHWGPREWEPEREEALRDLEEIAAASESVDREIQRERFGLSAAEVLRGGTVWATGLKWVLWAWRTCVRLAREYGPIVAAEAAPVIRKTCELISSPLDERPRIVRQCVGVVGAATVVYALAVLFYVVAIRSPHQEPAPPTDVVLRGEDGRGR